MNTLVSVRTNIVYAKKKKQDEKAEEEFIGNIEYNANTYELLDKMMASTQKLWQQYFQCLKDVNEEASYRDW